MCLPSRAFCRVLHAVGHFSAVELSESFHNALVHEDEVCVAACFWVISFESLYLMLVAAEPTGCWSPLPECLATQHTKGHSYVDTLRPVRV